jgi:hypothetical protein
MKTASFLLEDGTEVRCVLISPAELADALGAEADALQQEPVASGLPVEEAVP